MQTFINEELLAAARHQEKRRALLFRSLCALTAAAVVAECLLTRTGNAALMLRVLYATLIFPGLICIVFYLFALQPARRRISHLEGLLNREPEEREGRLTLTADAFRIPKSVPVRIVLLDTGEETLRLNLDEEWAPLAPPDGTLEIGRAHV